MEVSIRFDRRDPPEGVIRGKEGDQQPFTGWLGLLLTLAEVVADRG